MSTKFLLIGAGALLLASPVVADEQLQAGREVFLQEAQPSCTICHTLSDAEAEGAVGPNLDELQPTAEQVVQAVTGGVGVMPAFGELLSEEQIQAVAHYVSTVTRR